MSWQLSSVHKTILSLLKKRSGYMRYLALYVIKYPKYLIFESESLIFISLGQFTALIVPAAVNGG